MALAYLLSKSSAKFLRVNLNIPVIMVLSVIPDIDILFMPQLHRGPTHSVVMASIVFIPFFVFYGRKAVPYFLALISHSLIGDFLIGGQVMLFWPIERAEFGLHEIGSYYISIKSSVNVTLELTLLLIATIVMLKTRDILQFFEKRKSNLILTIPIFTVLLPTFVGYPFDAPLLETLPAEAVGHLFYIVLFVVSVLIALNGVLNKKKPRRSEANLRSLMLFSSLRCRFASPFES